MPFMPAGVRGTLVIMALMAFAGPDAEAEVALRPFRTIDKPIADLVRPMPYAGMFPPEDHSFHPTVAFRNFFKDRFTDADATIIVDRLANSDAPMRIAEIRCSAARQRACPTTPPPTPIAMRR